MNFISTFDELSKLYEEATPKVVNKKVDDLFAVMNGDRQVFAGTKEECENWLKDKKSPATTMPGRFKIVQGAEVPVKEACTKEELAKAAEDEIPVDDITVEEPIEDEEIEIVGDEPKQVVVECDKCGALVVIYEDDIKLDEESDLVNVDTECKFCEEKAGYRIIGTMVPYEAVESEAEEVIDEEPVEEPVEDELIEEGLGDVYRKVFDKPASTVAQQMWEDELNGECGEISDKRRAQLEKKFAQQRDWEARHNKDDEELEELLNISDVGNNVGNVHVNVDGGEGNDVDVLSSPLT